jgi:transcriptional regulator with XRE-family HTH domain
MRGRGRPPLTTGERRYPNSLREFRERRGLSQQAAAAAAGISASYYGALERGDKRINSDTAGRLAKALDVGSGELLGGSGADSVPLAYAVAAAESEARPPEYDLPEPHQRLQLSRLADADHCAAAEIFDDSADADFPAGTILVVRRSTRLAVGARVLVRFFLDPAPAAAPRRTHEILYGILDRNIVGDLVLITRTRNRMIPRHVLIQSAVAASAGLAERGAVFSARDVPLSYQPRADDPAELVGVVVYAMGPIADASA